MENERKWCLYIHTNLINDKKYICISKNAEERWGRNGHRYKYQFFGKAIKKYGWDNFSHEIIYTDLSLDEANALEAKLIKEYNTCDSKYGYNVLPGGDLKYLNSCGDYIPRNARKVYRYSLDGDYIDSYNSVAKAESIFGKGIDGCINNYSRTSNGYQWFSEYKGDHVPPKMSREEAIGFSELKKVHQYSLDGNYIREYSSIKEASELNHFERTQISNCLHGKAKTGHGYLWFFEYQGERVAPVNEYPNKPRPIYKYSQDGKLVKMYRTTREARKDTDLKTFKVENEPSFHNGYYWSLDYYPNGLCVS